MRVLEKQTLTIKDRNGKTNEEFGTFIPMNDFGMHTQKDALKYSLLALDAIEVTNRLNLFLKEFDKKPIDTGIFYRLLASILESGKDFTEDDQKQYFEVVKQLYKLSEPFYYVHHDLYFTPDYELDCYLLGWFKDPTDEYANLNYSFMNDEITYTEFIQKFKEQHPTE
ncbi:hypothetical protein [Capnocytophaga sp. H2931]|uniref:hypothetical protein n=1 Tax=Capnocytophaga sp. H2931 TaxID=1945657 RepID=UPI000BB1904C|nr:hypothetical protein [Capnocytophaga sp. H2931]ATA74913.1 hypothetical protein CGC52_05450 [Capnocytophaga sp. H2931]